MDNSETNRKSAIYRKIINLERNNQYNYSKDKDYSKYMNEFKEKSDKNNNIQTQINNNEQLSYNLKKDNTNKTNISLTYRRVFPYYNVENKNIININVPKKPKRNLKDNIFLSLLPRHNYSNILNDINNSEINTETNYAQNYYNNIHNFNILNQTLQDKEINTISQIKERFRKLNVEKINMEKNSTESFLNNSVFIKKKPKDNGLRNRSTHFRNKKILDESFNTLINQSVDNCKKSKANQMINNSNININISINNNYLIEENNNKLNYRVNKTNGNFNYLNNINIKKNKPYKRINKEYTKLNRANTKISEIINLNKNKYLKNYNNNESLTITKLYNLEDFLLIIQKFESIKEKFIAFGNNINKYNSKELLKYINQIRIRIYDLYKFYLSCSIEGSPQNLFSSKISKNYLQYYSAILILTIGLCYAITQKIKSSIEFHGKLLILLNLQEKAFMILCDSIIKKLHNNYQRNKYVIEIIKKLNNQLISNADTVNHILQIKMLTGDSYRIINDILINIYIYDEKEKSNEQEIFLYNNFYNKDFNYLTHFNINELEEIFDKNIFKAMNLRSSYANIASLKNSNNNAKNSRNNNRRISKEYINIKNISKIPYLNFPPSKKYTLVLDLDETMICFKFTEVNQGLGKLIIRPGLEEFLEEMKKYYEIIVFTSGTKDYAEAILNIIEQKNNTKYFNAVLYREHATLIGKKYIKDLSKLGRDLSRTIIVDNLPQSFKFQRENGILINSFYGDNMNDKALYELKKILIKIYNEKKDVRESIFKFREEIIKNVTCINEDTCKYKNQ